MSKETFRMHTPEHLYQMHADDVEAARQLGGIAVVGNSDPDAELSTRAEGILYHENGNYSAAADLAKKEIGKNMAFYSQINEERLDSHIRQAKEDMAHDFEERGPV